MEHRKQQNNIERNTECRSWSLIVTNAAAQLVVELIVKQLCELVGIRFTPSLILDTARCCVRQQFNQFCAPDWHSAAARHLHVLSFSVFLGCALASHSTRINNHSCNSGIELKLERERLNLNVPTGFLWELLLGQINITKLVLAHSYNMYIFYTIKK